MRFNATSFIFLIPVIASASVICADDAIQFVAEWGKDGDAQGQFHSPIGMAVTSDDVIYVTDLNNARIQKFNTGGEYLGGFALLSDLPDRKHSQVPGIVVADDGLVYVSFMLQQKIRVYSGTGEVIREWGGLGDQPGKLNGPGGLALGKDNLIYVADQRNHRVQIFSSDGKFVSCWGSHGLKSGQFGGLEPAGSRFGGPHFIARDSKGRLFTTEGTNGRVQRFDANGKSELSWGDSSDRPGGFGALETGFSKNPFGPVAVMVDPLDRVWVSSLNDRVQAFSVDGEFLFGIGTRGSGPAQFSRPHGMAMDSTGHLYVCDSSNQRIQKFKVVKPSVKRFGN